MPIPDFQSVMLPLLKFCADGQEYTNRQAIDALSQEFGLTEDEQKELLPSGQQCVFDNRVAWARAHMKMANLVENTRRGVFRITERGKDVLGRSPFSQSAHEYVASIDSKIILIDGQQLAQLMIDFAVGVATDATYELKRLDSDYFTEN